MSYYVLGTSMSVFKLSLTCMYILASIATATPNKMLGDVEMTVQ